MLRNVSTPTALLNRLMHALRHQNCSDNFWRQFLKAGQVDTLSPERLSCILTGPSVINTCLQHNVCSKSGCCTTLAAFAANNIHTSATTITLLIANPHDVLNFIARHASMQQTCSDNSNRPCSEDHATASLSLEGDQRRERRSSLRIRRCTRRCWCCC